MSLGHSTPSSPLARRDEQHGFWQRGQWYSDPYAWLEHLDAPETQQWIAAQAEITNELLSNYANDLRDTLSQASRYEQQSKPIKAGPHRIFWQSKPSDEKPILMIMRNGQTQAEVLLNPNTWPANEVMVFAEPSPNGQWLAIGKAVGSSHAPKIQIFSIETGDWLPDAPYGSDHNSVAWLPDSNSFLFTACPAPGDVPVGEESLWNAIYEHRLGSASDQRILGDDQHSEYWFDLRISENADYAVLYAWDYVHANTAYLLNLNDRSISQVTPQMQAINTVQVIGDTLLIHSDLDAPRGRVCVAPLATPQDWETLIPEGEHLLQSVIGVAGHYYVVFSQGGAHIVRIYNTKGEYLRELPLPALGTVNSNGGNGLINGISGTWAGDEVWIQFSSFLQASSLYRYHYDTNVLEPYYVPQLGIASEDYITKQVWYESADGTQVSMFLVHHKDLQRDQQNPVRLNGYGGFNISLEPRYSPLNVAWLKMGGVLAFANIRGGGEYGREWHQAALRTNRHKAFEDYIAAARWLVSSGYTTSSKLISRGNSNGGILVATTALQAPDAFGAVFCRAATLDMLTFPRFGYLSAAVTEFGSPDDPTEGAYLASYSPYHNISSEQHYPPIVFVSALNDHSAPPYDPIKMQARLRAENHVGGPYLLMPLHNSGHGGATTQSAQIEQDLNELRFYCWALAYNAQKQSKQHPV